MKDSWLLVVVCGWLCVAGVGCHSEPLPQAAPRATWPAPSSSAISEQEVSAFCGNCHALPPPSSFRRRDWPDEVSLGFTLFYASKRTDLNPPPLQRVIDFYQARAPLEYEFPASPRNPATHVTFSVETVAGPGDGQTPGVSAIQVAQDSPTSPPRILFGDMSIGDIYEYQAATSPPRVIKLMSLKHPCGFHRCDLDGDGKLEWIVGELGSFPPADHEEGKVEWFPAGTGAPANPTTLRSGMGRVADTRPVDVDRDGDQDLIVAEFGWRTTGKVSILENLGMKEGRPEFKEHLVDPRHGCIHVIPTELNGDSFPDFVALFAQEHETVVAYLSVASTPFTFTPQPIFMAQDPTFGSSGMELIDLDKDHDLDVVLTNGDAFDSGIPKPYHGVHWLENEGTFPFTHHRLVAMPGVHRAVTGDIDGDGDLDIACCALLPGNPRREFPEVSFPSVLWLEQRPDRSFIPHVLESDRCRHATCALADLERDGDLDLIVGEFALEAKSTDWLTIFRNNSK